MLVLPKLTGLVTLFTFSCVGEAVAKVNVIFIATGQSEGVGPLRATMNTGHSGSGEEQTQNGLGRTHHL